MVKEKCCSNEGLKAFKFPAFSQNIFIPEGDLRAPERPCGTGVRTEADRVVKAEAAGTGEQQFLSAFNF